MIEKIRLFEKKFWIHILYFCAAIALIVYFVPGKTHRQLTYEIGKPWVHNALFAETQMAVPMDSATVKLKKDSVNKAFIPFFKRDASVEATELKRLSESPLNSMTLRRSLEQVYRTGIVENDVWDKISEKKLTSIRIIRENSDAEVRNADNLLSSRTAYSFVTDNSLAFFSSNVADYIRPNLIEDTLLNRKYLENAYQLACARAPIVKGERIIDRGEIVTPQKALIIQENEKYTRNSGNFGEMNYSIVGFAILIFTLFFLLFVYFSYYRRESVLGDKRKSLFILIFISAMTIFSYTIVPKFTYGNYFLPLTLVPVVLVTFFDSRTAFFVSVIQVLLCCLVVHNQFNFIVMHLVASVVAINTLQELSKRSQLIRTAIFVFFTYSICYVATKIIADNNISGVDYRVFIYFAINAVMLSFAYVLIFVLEKLFGFVSKVTLVELSDVNSPLLQELSEKAPGTFQHSIQLSNLAAEAAREIGANSQLARAGALYHDIGKMENPAFFTENQHDVNPHELLSPEQSAKIVIRHVTDGLRLAEREKLPEVIRNFIREHHGLSMAKYFYTTACNENGGEPVDPTPYTYPGPNPRSKETAILMMADATEAASRSLKEYNDETISNLVNKIVDGQIAQGLMKESPLSFKDVEIVKKVFIARLRTMYHTRISYPELKKKA